MLWSSIADRCITQFADLSKSQTIKRRRRKVSLLPVLNLLSEWTKHYLLTIDVKEILTLASVTLLSMVFDKTTTMIMMTFILTASATLPTIPDVRFVRILIMWGAIHMIVNSFYICLRCLTVFMACVVLIPTVRGFCGKQTHPASQSPDLCSKKPTKRAKKTPKERETVPGGDRAVPSLRPDSSRLILSHSFSKQQENKHDSSSVQAVMV